MLLGTVKLLNSIRVIGTSCIARHYHHISSHKEKNKLLRDLGFVPYAPLQKPRQNLFEMHSDLITCIGNLSRIIVFFSFISKNLKWALIKFDPDIQQLFNTTLSCVKKYTLVRSRYPDREDEKCCAEAPLFS